VWGECAVLFRITGEERSQEARFRGLPERKFILLQMRMRSVIRSVARTMLDAALHGNN
jgi:hypothetical protein